MIQKSKIVLSQEGYAAIVLHHEHLIQVCRDTIAEYQQIPKANRPEIVTLEIARWKHVMGGLQWSLAIAQQRKRKEGSNESVLAQQHSGMVGEGGRGSDRLGAVQGVGSEQVNSDIGKAI